MRLSWDEGSGGGETSLTDAGPVRQRLAALDGRHRTIVTIEGAGEAHLACGGDSRTGLVLYLTFDNRTFHQLVDDAASASGERRVFAGQQEGRYPARYVVSLDVAVAAAEHYVIRGECAPTLSWEQC